MSQTARDHVHVRCTSMSNLPWSVPHSACLVVVIIVQEGRGGGGLLGVSDK